MTLDFNWWLLLVGLGFGAALTWLILADLGRREADLSARERANEVVWVADELAAEGTPASDQLVERVLQLHAAYLRSSPAASADEEDVLAEEDVLSAEDAAVGEDVGAADEASREGEAPGLPAEGQAVDPREDGDPV